MSLPGVGVFGTGGNAGLLVKSLRAEGFTVAAIWSPTLEAALDAGATLDVPFATNKVGSWQGAWTWGRF